MVVPYRSRGQQAECRKQKELKQRPRDLEERLYWKDQQSEITNGSYWSVDMYDNWNIKVDCVANFKGIPECKKQLDITVYSKYCSFARCCTLQQLKACFLFF